MTLRTPPLSPPSPPTSRCKFGRREKVNKGHPSVLLGPDYKVPQMRTPAGADFGCLSGAAGHGPVPCVTCLEALGVFALNKCDGGRGLGMEFGSHLDHILAALECEPRAHSPPH
jgi:hypothetical protein